MVNLTAEVGEEIRTPFIVGNDLTEPPKFSAKLVSDVLNLCESVSNRSDSEADLRRRWLASRTHACDVIVFERLLERRQVLGL